MKRLNVDISTQRAPPFPLSLTEQTHESNFWFVWSQQNSNFGLSITYAICFLLVFSPSLLYDFKYLCWNCSQIGFRKCFGFKTCGMLFPVTYIFNCISVCRFVCDLVRCLSLGSLRVSVGIQRHNFVNILQISRNFCHENCPLKISSLFSYQRHGWPPPQLEFIIFWGILL